MGRHPRQLRRAHVLRPPHRRRTPRDRAVPVLLVSGAHSAMLTPAEARNRGILMPHAEVATVPDSQGGLNRLAGRG